MAPASRRAGGGLLALLLGAGLLTACTGQSAPEPDGPSRTATPSGSSAPTPRASSLSPLAVPTAATPSSLPASPSIRLAPVKSSRLDLARVDVRNGSPRKRSAAATLPRAKGFTVTAGCVGVAGTLIHWSVVAQDDGAFLFGSTTPCNGAFLTDAGLSVADSGMAARLEVTIDPGVTDATVVLRRAVG